MLLLQNLSIHHGLFILLNLVHGASVAGVCSPSSSSRKRVWVALSEISMSTHLAAAMLVLRCKSESCYCSVLAGLHLLEVSVRGHLGLLGIAPCSPVPVCVLLQVMPPHRLTGNPTVKEKGWSPHPWAPTAAAPLTVPMATGGHAPETDVLINLHQVMSQQSTHHIPPHPPTFLFRPHLATPSHCSFKKPDRREGGNVCLCFYFPSWLIEERGRNCSPRTLLKRWTLL